MFYDRSGALSRRLQDLFPGLAIKRSLLDQRDFASPTEDLDLFFGVALSQIQTLAPSQQDFPATAARFLQIVTDVLEVSHLAEFHFRYVLGKPCDSDEAAQNLLWPMIPEETKAKLHTFLQPRQWKALQSEFLIGDLSFQSRIAILELATHPKLVTASSDKGKVVPHITFHLDVRGLVPIALAEFDAEGFMKNVRDGHAQEILDKLAPHLS